MMIRRKFLQLAGGAIACVAGLAAGLKAAVSKGDVLGPLLNRGPQGPMQSRTLMDYDGSTQNASLWTDPPTAKDTFDPRGRIVHYTEEQMAKMRRILPLPGSKPLPKGGTIQFHRFS